MQIVINIDPNVPRWLRRVVMYAAAPAVLAIATAVHADVAIPNSFATGDPLSSDKMNKNFEALRDAINANQTPPGALIAFAGLSCPQGYLEADGTANKTTYKALCDVLGTTWGPGDATTCVLPPLRNRFLRGAGPASDANGGTTVGVGVYQDDALKAHSHSYGVHVYYPTGGGPQANTDPGGTDDNYATSSVGVDETRPKSYGILWCIKY
jgi:hypothetical protein